MDRDEFSRRHDATIRRVLRRWTNNLDLINDLCQEGLLRFVKYEHAHGKFPEDEAFAVLVARQVYYSWARSSWVRRRDPHGVYRDFDQVSRENDPAETTQRTEESLYLLSLLDTLPPLYRESTRLHIVEGWTHERIARRENLSVSAVKMRFHRAIALLEDAVKEHFRN